MSQFFDISNKLLSWDVVKSLGFKDVLFDPATNTFGLWGPALKLELSVVKPGFVRNVDYSLNTSFAKHFGIPIELERWPNSYSVRNTKPMWFHGVTTQRDEGEHISEFLSGLGYAIRDVVSGFEDKDEGFDVTIIPEPGYLWTPDVTKENYSAKVKKVVKVEKPDWAEVISTRDGDAWAANLCKLVPIVCNSGGTSLVGTFQGNIDDGYIVTHSTSMTKVDEERIGRLASCPGMLFPSLAVGLIPATNFGETVLVAKPDIILPSMKPYRQRGQFPVITYTTDVWTETAGNFLTTIAVQTFDQLTGHADYTYNQHLYVLGPSINETGFDNEEAKIISSTTSLKRFMLKKAKNFRRDLTKDRFQQLSDLQSGERYGYLESKVNNVLSWDCIPLAVMPRDGAEERKKYLSRIGFKGVIIEIDIPRSVYDGDNYNVYQYAWLVRDAILDYAQRKNLFFSVSE